MNSFTIISYTVLFGLSTLCYFLPYKCGQKKTGLIVSLIFTILLTLTFIDGFELLTVFIWLIVFASQITFICYWTFRLLGKKKLGTIFAILLFLTFLSIILTPWFSDWTFSKNDARQLLRQHGLVLKDDFEMLENESGGLRDYYHTLRLKLSDSDYIQISERIKTSKNYKGLFTDLIQIPTADYGNYDTLDFETNYHFEREYFSRQQMDNGTYHFRFQLSKTDKVLSYIGSDE